MSSTLIKGFSIPEYNKESFKNATMAYSCHLYVNPDGSAELSIKGKDYSLVDIPSPHGDLIDRNDLLGHFESLDFNSMSDAADVYQMIDMCPTVIEAEGGQNELKHQ